MKLKFLARKKDPKPRPGPEPTPNTTPIESPSPETLPDADLLALSVSNPNHFNILVSRYQRLFLRKALEITRNEDDAYDVVQNTFVRIYASAKRFEPKHAGSFKSWAYTILVRQCYTLYRKQKRQDSFQVSLDPEFADVIADEGERRAYEQNQDMESALALLTQLPAKLRKVVELYFIEGKAQKDIARIEGLSPVAVRSRIHRAKNELRRLYAEANPI